MENIKIKDCRYGKMMYHVKDKYIGKSIEEYGEYSQAEADFFLSVIKPGSVVLDIGANIGAHTLVFAEAIGPASGYVLAYEPQKMVSYMLCGNIALNNLHNVYSFNQAVGLESGHIDVPLLSYETDNNFGGVSLKDKNWEENVMCYQVKMITIDSLNLQHCHFIKIDVEGMEIEVLKGAKETINRCKPFLYIEDDREDRSQELYDFIKELDYKSFAHHPPLFNPKNWAKNKDNVFGTVRSLNRFCAHKSVDVTI